MDACRRCLALVSVFVAGCSPVAVVPVEPATPGPLVPNVARTILPSDQGEVATSVIELDDGDYLLAGYDYDRSESISEWDSLVLRASADGQRIWSRSSDRKGSDYAWVVRSFGDGRYAVVGTREVESGDSDGFLQALDDDGNELWLRTYGGVEDEILWAAEQAADGGMMLVGQTKTESEGGWDVYVVRTDAAGEELWSESYGTPVTDRAFGVSLTPAGGALIAGFTGSSSGSMNFLLLRIDSQGNELWRRVIAGDRFDVAHDVLRLVDGGFVISGYTSSFGPGDHDGFLMRLTDQGRMLWLRTYGDGADDRILHVAEVADGGFALVGYSDWDVVVWRVDPEGELLWSYRDPGMLNDAGKDIIIAHTGAIVAVGGNRSENPPLDSIVVLMLAEQAQP